MSILEGVLYRHVVIVLQFGLQAQLPGWHCSLRSTTEIGGSRGEKEVDCWEDFPYITLTRKGVSTFKQIIDIVYWLQTKLPDLAPMMLKYSNAKRPFEISDHSWRRVQAVPGVGTFVAYQALVSFSYAQHAAGIMLYDRDVHVVTGNGANKALKRLFPKLKFGTPGASTAQRTAVANIRKHLPSNLSLRSAEHILYEWLKHRRGVVFYCRLFNVPLSYCLAREEGQRPRRTRRKFRGCVPAALRG